MRALLSRPVLVNDQHSGLNPVRVRGILRPLHEADVPALVRTLAERGERLAISGARHAMGGQQFAAGDWLLDTRALAQVHRFDGDAGLIEVGAGMQWPALLAACAAAQPGEARPWSIRQKQTGADDLTLGGSVSANIHGRGLSMAPFVSDVESFTLVDASGAERQCSRTAHPQLFRLAVGGYGLFGVITRVRLRLARREAVRREVQLCHAREVMALFGQKSAERCRYGDFQFCIDERDPEFLQRGILSCYRTLADEPEVRAPRELKPADWLELLALAYTDRAAGFRRYCEHYLATHGQTYRSDTHQLGQWLPEYQQALRARGLGGAASLVITELYVPRAALAVFLAEAARRLRGAGVPVVYGTVRLIEQDTETFLPWARGRRACVVFNLLVSHSRAGQEKARAAFRMLIDLALDLGGSFYLTYHRHATRAQVERAYPEMPAFLAEKERLDPGGVFWSEWYAWLRGLFGERVGAERVPPHLQKVHAA